MKFYFKLVVELLLCMSLCSQFNSAFFDGLYENMVSAEEVLKELSSSLNIGIKTVGKTVKFLEKFVDSTIEEDCIYKCPRRFEVLVPNPDYEPYVNGCGSLGLQLDADDLPRPEMIPCCNDHDRCYDSCGVDKEDCDKKFKRCLYSVCDLTKDNKNKIKHKVCQGGAKLLYTATMTLGCNSYKEAQSTACICKPIQSAGSDKKSWSTKSRQEL